MIQLENVSVEYRLKKETVVALKNLTIGLPKGSLTAVTGPSGSGKTTLMQLIGGLQTPSFGEVVVDGNKLHEFDDDQMASFRNSTVGFVFQFFNLPSYYTAVQNVALPLVFAGVPKDIRHAKAMALLSEFGLSDRAQHKPDELSGGEGQRVAIARALVGDPKIILADEPTGNLDRETGNRVMELLQQVSRGRGVTVIVVTHDEKVTTFADNIIRIEKGELVEHDTSG
jgi:putative ABC transport system ATP-binding protein